MTATDVVNLALISLAVVYTMVAVGVHKRLLTWKVRRCPSCGADVRSCRCRRRAPRRGLRARRS